MEDVRGISGEQVLGEFRGEHSSQMALHADDARWQTRSGCNHCAIGISADVVRAAAEICGGVNILFAS